MYIFIAGFFFFFSFHPSIHLSIPLSINIFWAPENFSLELCFPGWDGEQGKEEGVIPVLTDFMIQLWKETIKYFL